MAPPTHRSHPRVISRHILPHVVDEWDDAVTSIWTAPGASIPEIHDTRIDPPRFVMPPASRSHIPLAAGSFAPLPRAATAVEPAPAARPPRRGKRSLVIVASAVATLAAAAATAIAIIPSLVPPPTAPTPILVDDATSARAAHESRPALVAVTAEETTRARYPRAARYRDAWRASAWHHPLAAERLFPSRDDRRFGARRKGRRPSECGRGHCGVDLGQRGIPVVAARDGIVERAERRNLRKTGKFVRIGHADGFMTQYLHLDELAAGLAEGDRVEAGDPIGIAGGTGIRRSAPHLHFAIAYRKGKQKFYIDPEPMLKRSALADIPPGGEAAQPEVAEADPPVVRRKAVRRGKASAKKAKAKRSRHARRGAARKHRQTRSK